MRDPFSKTMPYNLLTVRTEFYLIMMAGKFEIGDIAINNRES